MFLFQRLHLLSRRQAFGYALAITAGLLVVAQFALVSASTPGTSQFLRTWERTDKPVADGSVSRTWMWGPEGNTGVIQERYDDAPGGMRNVQYFDKSRMEDNSYRAEAPWDVTNGLLVMELVTGRMQVGDATYLEYTSSEHNVAGDPDDVAGPTYAAMKNVLYAPSHGNGQVLTTRIDRNGLISNDTTLEMYGVTAAHLSESPTVDHQVASPFWAFMNSTAKVWENGQLVDAALFQNPFYATGLPITEGYWATVKVNNRMQDVLVQCFERRCLTYTPGNDPTWQVEAGNVGQHYFAWRQEVTQQPEPEPTNGPESPTQQAPTATATTPTTPTASPTATSTPTATPTWTVGPSATPTMTDYTTNETGRASKIPWSGPWWPFAPSTLPNLYDEGRTLSKYDAYVLKKYKSDPGARVWEMANHGSGPGWWGHCHAWAAAAVGEPEPKAVTVEGISFTADEVKGLITEMYHNPQRRVWGRQCRDNCSQDSPEFKDVTPADFDFVIREYIGKQKVSVLMDMDPNSQLWNYPIYSYQRSSSVSGGIETVTMRVTYARPEVGVSGTVSSDKTYEYQLKEGTDGTWLNRSVRDHPDFLWVLTGRGNGGNPKMRMDIVNEIRK